MEFEKHKNFVLISIRFSNFDILCGCIGAYRATVATINLINRWSGKCLDLTKSILANKELSKEEQTPQQACDDQILLNHLYAYDLKVTWVQLPGFSGIYGKVRPGKDNSATHKLNVMLFDPLKVIRGGQPYNCLTPGYDKPWILNPTNFQGGNLNKLYMFYIYRDCMFPSKYMTALKNDLEELLRFNNFTKRTGDRAVVKG